MSKDLRYVTASDLEIEDSPWGPHEWISRPGLTPAAADGLLMVRVRMPVGRAHQFHHHPEMEEIIYVESGVAEQWVDRTHRELKAGECAYIPKGVVHATHNVGNDTLVFLAILSPAKVSGPALVDVHKEEPWRTLKAPQVFPGMSS